MGILISGTVKRTVFDLLKIVLMSIVLLSLIFSLLDSHGHLLKLLLIIFSITYHNSVCCLSLRLCNNPWKSMKIVGASNS